MSPPPLVLPLGMIGRTRRGEIWWQDVYPEHPRVHDDGTMVMTAFFPWIQAGVGELLERAAAGARR